MSSCTWSAAWDPQLTETHNAVDNTGGMVQGDAAQGMQHRGMEVAQGMQCRGCGAGMRLRSVSTWSSGDFWLRSAKASPSACCVCTRL